MTQFDRQAEDIGNILLLEHVNLRVPDQSLATFFYVNGLGFTRDPYIDFGPFNVWLNIGRQQIHIPTGKPQKLRGEIGIALPDLESLLQRLPRIESKLAGTQFRYEARDDHVMVTCPWGNKLRCLKGTPDMPLGMPYVEFEIPTNRAAEIARFYEQTFNVRAETGKNTCKVWVGKDQQLRFREVDQVEDYDGHHIAIYTPDFSRPYHRIKAKGWIMEESDQHQYRFKQLFNIDDGKPLYEIEHEVRSLRHPMYNRPLINRNPEQTFSNYTEGRDAFYPNQEA